jgi:two-component system, OmpR family, phosphate regulon sensor histidine kinase PhoR
MAQPMHKRTNAHIQFIVWLFACTILFGLLIDELAWSLVVFLTLYVVWTLRQASRLHNWLYRSNSEQGVPESYGLWGDLFEGIYNSQQQNKKARERLSAMIERVRKSADAMDDAVIMTNGAGQMDWWNRAASLLFGFDVDKDRAQIITNLVRDPEFKAYFEAKDYNDTLEIISPHDPNLIVRIQITLFGEDERLVFAQDITRLNQLEQMRKDFVSNVSHEMRTPLTVIRGYVETMLDSGSVSEKWLRPLKAMEGQTLRLEELITDLLLLEKYEAKDGTGMDEKVNIEELVASICNDAEIVSGGNSHEIQFKSQTSAQLLGAQNQLRSAFSNLIYNAVKYTPEGGSITVEWKQDHAGCHLSVVDTGCGFDPVHIPRLTERFYRADPSRHLSTGGSGLGLAIVKHVLINHGATLEVHSQLNKGSEFICHFPNSRVIKGEASRLEINV